MKHQSFVLLVAAGIITLASIYFFDSSVVIGAMCGAFLAAASMYTALDLRAVVKATQDLPVGRFQKAALPKYYVAIVIMSVLLAACAVRQYLTGMALDLAMGLLGPGIVGLLAIIIGGLKCNKAVTGTADSGRDPSSIGSTA